MLIDTLILEGRRNLTDIGSVREENGSDSESEDGTKEE